MQPGSWTRPGSVALSSNDNGCEGVIKHRTDAPQASVSLVLLRLTEVCWGRGVWGGGGGGGIAQTILRLALHLCQL